MIGPNYKMDKILVYLIDWWYYNILITSDDIKINNPSKEFAPFGYN